MHICFVTNEYPKQGHPHGGVGSFVKTMAQHLVRQGIDVSVVGVNYTRSSETTTDHGVNIYRLSNAKFKGLTWWLRARAISKKLREIHKIQPFSVVETAELGLAYIDKIPGVRYVIRLHGGHHFFAEAENRGINWWKGYQEIKSFARADAFVAVSDYVRLHTQKYLSFHNKPVALIRYPLDTQLFQPIAIPVVTQRIVFAGTVCEKKGVRQLIQAFGLVKKEFPDATLEIYGRDWFFPNGSSYMKMLQKEEISRLGVWKDDVHLHGAVAHTELPKHYAAAAVCVFPSHMETQGLVAPEAMLMEKAVVFTKMGPGPETIAHGQTGLLCDPRDPKDIARWIGWVLSNPDAALDMGRKARQKALQTYGLDTIGTQNLAFYRSL